MNRELKEMRALVEELHSALRAEQAEKSNLQVKRLKAALPRAHRGVLGLDFALGARRKYIQSVPRRISRGEVWVAISPVTPLAQMCLESGDMAQPNEPPELPESGVHRVGVSTQELQPRAKNRSAIIPADTSIAHPTAHLNDQGGRTHDIVPPPQAKVVTLEREVEGMDFVRR